MYGLVINVANILRFVFGIWSWDHFCLDPICHDCRHTQYHGKNCCNSFIPATHDTFSIWRVVVRVKSSDKYKVTSFILSSLSWNCHHKWGTGRGAAQVSLHTGLQVLNSDWDEWSIFHLLFNSETFSCILLENATPQFMSDRCWQHTSVRYSAFKYVTNKMATCHSCPCFCFHKGPICKIQDTWPLFSNFVLFVFFVSLSNSFGVHILFVNTEHCIIFYNSCKCVHRCFVCILHVWIRCCGSPGLYK